MSEEDKKCAPEKKYTNGSCFTLLDLENMALSFNIFIDNGEIKGEKINIINDKKHLLKELTSRLEGVCSDQICWLKQNFIKKIKNKDILNHTFRPSGPQGKFEWLSP